MQHLTDSTSLLTWWLCHHCVNYAIISHNSVWSIKWLTAVCCQVSPPCHFMEDDSCNQANTVDLWLWVGLGEVGLLLVGGEYGLLQGSRGYSTLVQDWVRLRESRHASWSFLQVLMWHPMYLIMNAESWAQSFCRKCGFNRWSHPRVSLPAGPGPRS